MKTFLSILFLLIFFTVARSQRECGTKQRRPLVHHDTLRPVFNRLTYTTPYPIGIFIHVFTDDNGTNPAVEDTVMVRQINNMVAFYTPQNICFIVVGFERIRNTALLDMDADNEESQLSQYLVPDCIDIFVHSTLFSTQGSLAGNAYDIPNDYLSVVSEAMESTTNISTLAHEMGHCLGLLHTFQVREDNNNNTIRERVLRSGACSNCTTEGDLVCDTEADWDVNESSINSTTCEYEGNQLYDDCSELYIMTPTNLMTYGRKSCRDHFTNGQRSRMTAFLTSIGFLVNCIAEDNLTISSNQVINSGIHVYAARNQVTANAQLSFTGSMKASFSATEVTISPGTSFSPGVSGAYVQIRAGTLCQ